MSNKYMGIDCTTICINCGFNWGKHHNIKCCNPNPPYNPLNTTFAGVNMSHGSIEQWRLAPAGVKCNVAQEAAMHYQGNSCGKSPIPEGSLAFCWGFDKKDKEVWWCYQCAILVKAVSPPADIFISPEMKVPPAINVAKKLMKIISFGYNKGIPDGNDNGICRIVVDVRKGIRNPWKDKVLRKKNGLDVDVQNYIKRCPKTAALLKKIDYYPLLGIETVYIGCFGGKHRSVAIAEMYAEQCRKSGYEVEVIHRDLKVK